MRKARFVWIAGAAIAGWLAAASGGACAELRVIESNVPGVERDAAYAEGTAFDVPAGKKIKFLKDGSTFEIVGPYTGTLANYRPGCGWWARLKGECAPNTKPAGGTRDAAPRAGGTRGIRAPE